LKVTSRGLSDNYFAPPGVNPQWTFTRFFRKSMGSVASNEEDATSGCHAKVSSQKQWVDAGKWKQQAVQNAQKSVVKTPSTTQTSKRRESKLEKALTNQRRAQGVQHSLSLPSLEEEPKSERSAWRSNSHRELIKQNQVVTHLREQCSSLENEIHTLRSERMQLAREICKKSSPATHRHSDRFH